MLRHQCCKSGSWSNDDLENGVRKEKLKLMLINQHHFSWKLAIVCVHMGSFMICSRDGPTRNVHISYVTRLSCIINAFAFLCNIYIIYCLYDIFARANLLQCRDNINTVVLTDQITLKWKKLCPNQEKGHHVVVIFDVLSNFSQLLKKYVPHTGDEILPIYTYK